MKRTLLKVTNFIYKTPFHRQSRCLYSFSSMRFDQALKIKAQKKCFETYFIVMYSSHNICHGGGWLTNFIHLNLCRSLRSISLIFNTIGVGLVILNSLRYSNVILISLLNICKFTNPQLYYITAVKILVFKQIL